MSESTGTPRRGRFRFLYQFSLRTLLLATAGVAIFCNWYFQPKYHEDELAGKDLRVRQQRKSVVRMDRYSSPHVSLGGPGISEEVVNHGRYTLLDGDDFVLSRGQFTDGSASGRWVTCYPTGNKAAAGKMHSGVKVGLWRTWYEDGTLASEVTYADKPVERVEPYISGSEWWIAIGGPGFGRGFVPERVKSPHLLYTSSREGPIKSWYSNGQLRYEGQNAADQQEGLWKFYDEQGRLTASGPYRAGIRHGTWTIVGQASRLPSHSRSEWTTLTVEFIDGRTRDELDRLFARLDKQLDSPQRYRCTQALIDLAEVGEGAVPLLKERLATSNTSQQQAILSVLPRMNAAAEPLLPRVRELSKSSDAAVSHQARLTLFQLDAGSRELLYAPLVAEAIAAPKLSDCLRELVLLYRCDASRQAAVFALLMELTLERSDADDEPINAAVAELGGDVGPHLAAALESNHEAVRLQGARALLYLFTTGWRAETYVSFDEPTWNKILARLQSDPSQGVRALAPEIEQGPRSPVGGLGGGGGGGGFF